LKVALAGRFGSHGVVMFFRNWLERRQMGWKKAGDLAPAIQRIDSIGIRP
jgi:hypothetical protein